MNTDKRLQELREGFLGELASLGAEQAAMALGIRKKEDVDKAINSIWHWITENFEPKEGLIHPPVSERK